MRVRRISGFAAVVLLIVAAPSFSSLESAKALYRQGRFAEAMKEIEAELAAEPEEAERSRLLDLLGAAAARQGDYWKALETWQLLIGEYPESPGAEDAVVKVSLVAALLECLGEGELPESSASAEEGEEAAMVGRPDTESQPAMVEQEAAAAEPQPVMAETEAAEAPPVRPAEAPAAVAAARPERIGPAEQGGSGLVLVASRGKPYDALEEAEQIVLDFLASRGVLGESATGGIPVVEKSEALLPRLLERVADRGAESLLVVTANFSGSQKIEGELFAPDGNPIWREKASGGTGWTGRGYSRTGLNEELLDRFLEKLEERIGEPGLPVTASGE